MELRHLRYFIAVGEEQNYGRAAQRLRIAQPALSRQIQDLENEIGFKLFDRLPRGVKLSAAGKLFLEDPDAGSYAPVTILVDERPDGVYLSYDSMASLLAPYGNQDALAVAR